MDEEARSAFFVSLPKIELHAHLNASLSEKTIKDLLQKTYVEDVMPASTFIEKGAKRTLKECFDMFKVVQKLTCTSEVVTYATKTVINDFAEDGVIYLELRSTPRANLDGGSSKRTYVNAVLRGIREYQKENPGQIDVRYLLSIDRRLGVDEARSTVELAKEFLTDDLVIGVDLSGDPCMGDARDYIPILRDAKSAGLRLAIHMAEIEGLDDESLEVLQLPPGRIGHGIFLYGNKKCRDIVVQRKIPLEICLTSNVKSESVKSYGAEHHHIHKWHGLGHPYAVCTDGKGTFHTSASNEFKIAAEVCRMSNQDVYKLSKSSVEYIFAGKDVKDKLYQRFESWKSDNQHYFS